jgi:DMSO/TMAO reductase YedYZ molybdopterin-dependent catalytic subunit
MSDRVLTRRNFLRGGAIAGASLTLAGCDQFDFLADRDNAGRDFLEGANQLTYQVQRLLLGRDALAPEYAESEIRQGQRPNGSRNPASAEYVALRQANFTPYRLNVTGLVDNPQSLSLIELRNMGSRTQITRHDCVEGWSCIAKWTGTPLHLLLDEAGVKPTAKYLVFHCYDTLGTSLAGPVPYYESCDLIDARHPQTILAYGLNGAALPIANGAPLRVRIERQLGYKQPKYVHTIELVDDFSPFHGGHGGYWEDRGYEWYGGI